MKGKFLYNNKALRDRRRELRNNSTPEEKLLWSKLKNKQINGLKFVRQYSVGPYILDFYCPKLRFAIELDGDHHNEKEAKSYDKERDTYLQVLNIQTIRFWNSEVSKNIDTIIDKIQKALTLL